jgi:hypothetical protein
MTPEAASRLEMLDQPIRGGFDGKDGNIPALKLRLFPDASGV